MKLHDGEEADVKLAEFRRMYEPYIYALANYLNQTLPPWIPQKKAKTIGKPPLGRGPLARLTRQSARLSR